MTDRRVADPTTFFVMEDTLDNLNKKLQLCYAFGLYASGSPTLSRITDPPDRLPLYIQAVECYDPNKYTFDEATVLTQLP